MSREFDIVVHGATGFTGKLVAEYLAARGCGRPWAISGRSAEKLEAVKAELGIDVPAIVADASDPASLAALAARTRVVITTVGPYLKYGAGLVAACAEAGTDLVDLCGEPPFMARMIEAHGARAKETGARIVHSCGFDSVPFDLGVLMLQEAAKARFGAYAPRVKGRVRKMKGAFSGGTAASSAETTKLAMTDPAVRAALLDPFALCEGQAGPRQPHGGKPQEDEALGAWVAPFVMAIINTKNVHRSHFLMGRPWGEGFAYDEMLVTGPGEKGRAIAEGVAKAPPMGAEPNAPKPGEGPSKEERETGFYDLLFIGEWPDGRRLDLSVKGDRDPGYGSTSKMIAECALALLEEAAGREGGVLTPAAAFGPALAARLEAHAGLKFAVES